MKAQQHTSLGETISKKMSGWVLILVVGITIAIFFTSYLLSRQMFNQQVSIWNSVAPQYALTNLIDSDYFSISREIKFLESTGLFSSFVITDNQKRIIAKFGDEEAKLLPIQDEAKVTWGYYSYTANFYSFFSPFLIAEVVFSILALLFYFLIQWRIRSSLEKEFLKFNQFLVEIEMITEKLDEIYNKEESEININTHAFDNVEQEIINRSVSRLFSEIKKANQSLKEAILASEQKKFREELTRTALQVAHDIGSPLAALEAVVQSSMSLPEESRVSVRNSAARIRDISNSLLKTAKQELASNNEEPLLLSAMLN